MESPVTLSQINRHKRSYKVSRALMWMTDDFNIPENQTEQTTSQGNEKSQMGSLQYLNCFPYIDNKIKWRTNWDICFLKCFTRKQKQKFLKRNSSFSPKVRPQTFKFIRVMLFTFILYLYTLTACWDTHICVYLYFSKAILRAASEKLILQWNMRSSLHFLSYDKATSEWSAFPLGHIFFPLCFDWIVMFELDNTKHSMKLF